MKGIVGHRSQGFLTSKLVLRVARQRASDRLFVKVADFRARPAIHAAAGRENEPADSQPLADMSQGENAKVIAAVCKLNIDLACGVPDEAANPYHTFTPPQKRQHFICVSN